MIEKKWLKINDIHSSNINSVKLSDIYIMKNADIGFFIAEIYFTTKQDEEIFNIEFNIPELKNFNFSKSESVVYATKNNDSFSMVNITLTPGKLVLSSYPFSSDSLYEINVQLTLRFNTKNTINLSEYIK